MFDLFEQGDVSGVRAAGGLGIGLHVVKRLVEQHGGEVSVESPGEQLGSIFTVSLPLAPSATDRAAAATAPAPAAVRP